MLGLDWASERVHCDQPTHCQINVDRSATQVILLWSCYTYYLFQGKSMWNFMFADSKRIDLSTELFSSLFVNKDIKEKTSGLSDMFPHVITKHLTLKPNWSFTVYKFHSINKYNIISRTYQEKLCTLLSIIIRVSALLFNPAPPWS